MIKYFCCSDIHSFYAEWLLALNKLNFNIEDSEHHIIICGDLFDRGPDTVKCYDFVKHLAEQNRLHYVRGNHEDLLEDLIMSIYRNSATESYHLHNGTLDTLAQLMSCHSSEVTYYHPQFKNICTDLLMFINQNCVDYFELGDTVFVHGYVPSVEPSWRDGDWVNARWVNGIDAWRTYGTPENKKVVCGHWHCSYAWSHVEHKYKEFPQPTHEDFNHSFKPYIKDTFIALDACTAYSHKVNVLIFDEDGKLIS